MGYANDAKERDPARRVGVASEPLTTAMRRDEQGPPMDGQSRQAEAMTASPRALAQRQRLAQLFPNEDLQSRHQSRPQPHGLVQRRRDPTAASTRADFEANANSNKRGDEAGADDTLAVAERNYQASLQSGRNLFAEGLKWFTNDRGKARAVDPELGTNASVAAAQYKVFWFFPDAESVTVCMIRGEGFDDLANHEVGGYSFDDRFEDDQSYMYANTFNVKTGAFHASINYRNRDIEVATEEGLPAALSNSEIIWFQQALAKKVHAAKFPAAGRLSEITSITREAIGNTRSLDTIFIADTHRRAFEGGTERIDEPSEEAMALLGTPNGNSAVWILIQHEESGTVDIECIEFKEDELVIRYMR